MPNEQADKPDHSADPTKPGKEHDKKVSEPDLAG
jgi:hypothetical protein